MKRTTSAVIVTRFDINHRVAAKHFADHFRAAGCRVKFVYRGPRRPYNPAHPNHKRSYTYKADAFAVDVYVFNDSPNQ